MSDLLTPAQLQARWNLKTRATLDTWRARDKQRVRAGLEPVGPKWVDISPAGSGRPMIRYPMADLLFYERANKIMVGEVVDDKDKSAQGASSPTTNPNP